MEYKCVWLRANPPHQGHIELIESAGKDAVVLLSATQNKDNILPVSSKKYYLQESGIENTIVELHGNVLNHLSKIYDEDVYDDLVMYFGSDRAKEFERLLKKYNRISSTHGYYDFRNISIMSPLPDRDIFADDVAGFSSTKLKECVRKNDKKLAFSMMPNKMSESVKNQLFEEIRILLL